MLENYTKFKYEIVEDFINHKPNREQKLLNAPIIWITQLKKYCKKFINNQKRRDDFIYKELNALQDILFIIKWNF